MDEEKELTRGEQLRKALAYEKKNGWDRLLPEEREPLDAYCAGYKQFLDAGKTERECVDRTVALAEAAGFRAYSRGESMWDAPMTAPSDRLFFPITASMTALPRFTR